MKKCPYCGHGESENGICMKCRAEIPAEKPKEQPVKAEKKTNKE